MIGGKTVHSRRKEVAAIQISSYRRERSHVAVNSTEIEAVHLSVYFKMEFEEADIEYRIYRYVQQSVSSMESYQ